MREVCASAVRAVQLALLSADAPADNNPAARHNHSLAHQQRHRETTVSLSGTPAPLIPAHRERVPSAGTVSHTLAAPSGAPAGGGPPPARGGGPPPPARGGRPPPRRGRPP